MTPNFPGQYELQQRLDSSSVEEVWKAFDTQRRLYVSLKMLHIAAQAPANLLPYFTQEMSKVATLRQPNIVPLLDYHVIPSADGSHDVVVITKYVEGPSLTDYLNSTARRGAFPTGQELIQLLLPIAAALDYAHQRGILHGGIKPANILFDKLHTDSFSLGEPYLTGFGLQQLHPLLALPLQDVYYISPEVARGYIGTSRSDLYSLGVILYELCTGVLPFQGDAPTDIITQHIHALPTSPSLINPHILPAVTAVIMRALAKEPEARFSTALAMVVALAKAYNVPVQEDLSRSGPFPSVSMPASLSLSYLNLANAEQDSMNSATYLSNPPRTSFPTQAASVPSVPSVPPTSGLFPTAPVSATPVLPMLSLTPQPSVVRTPEAQSVQDAPLSPASTTPVSAIASRVSKKRRLYIILSSIIIIALLGSALFSFFVLQRHQQSVAGKPIAGYAFFVSSGLISMNNSNGIADRVQLKLNGLPALPASKLYYVWLMPDSDTNVEISPILLGTLPAQGGDVHLTYAGDASHTDLLAMYSRLRITEENANPQPTNPSLDSSTWRYYAAFSQQPNPLDTVSHYSLLAHLRHLLAMDSSMNSMGSTGSMGSMGTAGGLDILLFRDAEKILEWAGSARDAQQHAGAALVHRQMIRILDYIDGTQYLQPDLPAGTPLLVDPAMATMPLLHQMPPGSLKEIGNHLREIIQCPGVTAEQRALAIQINAALNNVQNWLQAVHDDAVLLARMNDQQLLQPNAATLLNHIFIQASNAFTGQVDPNTNQVIPGVVQIHYNIQRMATMDITACTGTGTNPCV